MKQHKSLRFDTVCLRACVLRTNPISRVNKVIVNSRILHIVTTITCCMHVFSHQGLGSHPAESCVLHWVKPTMGRQQIYDSFALRVIVIVFNNPDDQQFVRLKRLANCALK